MISIRLKKRVFMPDSGPIRVASGTTLNLFVPNCSRKIHCVPGRNGVNFLAKLSQSVLPRIGHPRIFRKYRSPADFVDCAGYAGNQPHLETSTVNLRTALISLLVLVLGLPILSVVLTWVAGLLTAMGDTVAANVLGHINTAVRVLWLAALVGNVVVLALESLDRSREE
jgi:hypothetical protein